MASRIIHLAITMELAKCCDFKDINRLYFGAIIPDGTSNRQEYLKSHFKMQIGEKERTYDLTCFRNQFSDLMLKDDLYMGYYLHLIQDLLYRHFVYDRYNWDPRPAGNLERLYDDYRQINAYIIKEYDIKCELQKPKGFAEEPINRIALMDLEGFLGEYRKDFEEVEYKERFFFTDGMVDEYIQWAVGYCKKELDALRSGTHYFDEYEWSWGNA